uniref:RES domain-containing protein n=1 Tax=Bursaphelenchus xylophilus TaxID=6326 RepID=A0A1I7RQY9_BURXY
MQNDAFLPLDQRQIFEIFQYPFGHLNRLYLNSLYFRADDSKLLLNLGIYAQADCFTHFYSNDRHPHASAQILKPFQIKVVKIAKKFKNIRIDAVETAALAGIILWRDCEFGGE